MLGFWRRGLKVKCVLLQGRNLKIENGVYDESKKLVRTKKHNYAVEEDHFFYSKRMGFLTTYVFIDVNSRKSLSDEQIHGGSISPKLAKELDAKLENKLDYLSEASYWESLNVRKRDFVEMLITMGCGIGLYSIFRVILAMYGYYLP